MATGCAAWLLVIALTTTTPILAQTSPSPALTRITNSFVKLEQIIGQTGIALYAHTPAWKNNSHELWSRLFTFQKRS